MLRSLVCVLYIEGKDEKEGDQLGIYGCVLDKD